MLKRLCTILIMTGLVVAQTTIPYVAFQSVIFVAVGTGAPVNLTRSGVNFHQITWYKSGTVSSCTVRVDSSADGITWSAGGAITAQTCTSNGTFLNTSSTTVNFIRINVTAFGGSGAHSVRVDYAGYINNPSGGSGTITGSGTAGYLTAWTDTEAIGNSVCDYGVTTANILTCAPTGGLAVTGSNGGVTLTEGDGSGLTAATGKDLIFGNSSTHKLNANLNNGGAVVVLTTGTQYSKGSCSEVWGGSGTSFALTSGDDAIANNSCYNDSGVTRTITAVKCRNDNASNTTTVNPTFGAAGTGTTILSGALTCGNSYAYSATGTVSNASWTTGTGITPAMAGTLTGTSVAMIVEYTF